MYLLINDTSGSFKNNGHMSKLRIYHLSTAIGLWKHRIPSDLRS